MPETPIPLEAEVDPRLLEVLVCPVTRGPLTYDRERAEMRLAPHQHVFEHAVLERELRLLWNDRDPLRDRRSGQ